MNGTAGDLKRPDMEIYRMLKIGEEIEAESLFIMNARRRFLTSQLWKIQSEIAESISHPWQSLGDVAIFLYGIENDLYSKWTIKKELNIIDRMIFKQKDQIDEGMIERAKLMPIETIIEFTKRKTRCISSDHIDKHPSAYYASRTNRLMCPVCQKSWDAIACYQYVHGCDFKTAVKNLQ